MFLIDRTISDDSQEQDSTSFEEQDSADQSHKLPSAPEKPPSTRFVDLFPQLSSHLAFSHKLHKRIHLQTINDLTAT